MATSFISSRQGQGRNGPASARQTFVTTGATRGDQVAVLKGLKEGDTVVTAGQIKLKNGTPVVDRQHGAADADPTPTQRPLSEATP